MKQACEIALAYPYERPSSSFIIRNGVFETLEDVSLLAGRTAVLACGSNGAPEQLLRKFKNTSTEAVIATHAKLEGFACCYSAHITTYGAIPATLAPMPGVQTECHITWLTPNQLQHMHQTEALGLNYRFSRLDNISIFCDLYGPLESATAYISLHGNLIFEGNPIMLAGIPAQTKIPVGKTDQYGIQQMIIDQLSLNMSVEEFLAENIGDTGLRENRIQALKKYSQAFKYAHKFILAP